METFILQAIEEMDYEQGYSFLAQITLAKLEWLADMSQEKLRCIKANILNRKS